jgi:hypothetical protein
VISLALLFLLKIVLAIQGILCLHISFKYDFSLSVKNNKPSGYSISVKAGILTFQWVYNLPRDIAKIQMPSHSSGVRPDTLHFYLFIFLPSKHEVLSSNPSATRKKKKIFHCAFLKIQKKCQ